MSQSQRNEESSQPQPIVYEPDFNPGEEFGAAHRGVHDHNDRIPRPFHPTKCAHNGTDIIRRARAGVSDAHQFIQALLDVVQDNCGGTRPEPEQLQFIVNTGTPSKHDGWVLSVRMTAPLNAFIKLVCSPDGAWEYLIERSNIRPRRPAATADRPLHPRRRRGEESAQPKLPPELFPPLPGRGPTENERYLDI